MLNQKSVSPHWQDTAIAYLSSISNRSQVIYLLILSSFTLFLTMLPFIKVNVTVNCPGIIRPRSEKSIVRTIVSGQIDSILVADGAFVHSGQQIITLDQSALNSKLGLNTLRQQQLSEEISDLQKITSARNPSHVAINALLSPNYRKQLLEFREKVLEKKIYRNKLQRDFEISDALYRNGKVVSYQEKTDKAFELEKSVASEQIMYRQQLSTWQNELTNRKIDLQQLGAESQQLLAEKSLTIIRSPVDGHIQELNGRYRGSFLQPSDLVCQVSPVDSLLAECYLSPADAGLIRVAMPVQIEIDAFSKNYWGSIPAVVQDIGKDFQLNEDRRPVFLVRCHPLVERLYLKSGYASTLRKGMTITARFVLARRSLWQLIWDNVNDWLPGT